jgi:hypothetical protein
MELAIPCSHPAKALHDFSQKQQHLTKSQRSAAQATRHYCTHRARKARNKGTEGQRRRCVGAVARCVDVGLHFGILDKMAKFVSVAWHWHWHLAWCGAPCLSCPALLALRERPKVPLNANQPTNQPLYRLHMCALCFCLFRTFPAAPAVRGLSADSMLD